MASVAYLEFASAVLMFLGYSWLVGALCSRFCLGAGNREAALGSVRAIRHGEPLAAILCIVAGVMSLYAGAAAMSSLPLSAAYEAFWITLTRTAVGRNCLLSLAVMALVVGCTVGAPRRWKDLAMGMLLAAFASCYAMTSHAAEEGVLSVAFAMEWLHLMLVALWVGIVVLAAWIIVPRYRDASHSSRAERDIYLTRLSTSATVALGVLMLSGIYNAVVRVGSWADASGNPYATTLLIKVALVFLALAIGAYNRFFGFPAIVSSGKISPALLLLRTESFLLVGALAAAVLLGSISPPSSL